MLTTTIEIYTIELCNILLLNYNFLVFSLAIKLLTAAEPSYLQ